MRRLILCLDGTWNNAYAESKRHETGERILKPTNVLKMARSILPQDATGTDQVVYYDIGVGSLAVYPGFSNRLLHAADRILGGGWGAGFEENIEHALEFLSNNLMADDEVFIFGFSRGAATAHAITNFLTWCGGLPAKNDAYYLPVLFRAYVAAKGAGSSREAVEAINTTRDAAHRAPLEAFRPVAVRLLGVWDTVLALGSRFRATGTGTTSVHRSFYVTKAPAACVAHARHALAVDETRYDFRPEIWQDNLPGQTLEQRWFPGVHSNVGGGYVDDGLANGAFQWILHEATSLGLAADRDFARHYRPFPQDRLYRSESFVYRALDALRFRMGRGRRVITATRSQTLDKSVVIRMQADPRAITNTHSVRFPELAGRAYRPENVIAFLASITDLDDYLHRIDPTRHDTDTLPTGVLEELARRRRARSS